MSFNKIYSGMENAPQAIDENFKNSFPQDEILTDETAATLGVTEENPTPEMAFKIIGEKAMPPEGEHIWHSGNLPRKSGSFEISIKGSTVPGAPTYGSVRTCFYEQIGDWVELSLSIAITNKGGMEGPLLIYGVPTELLPKRNIGGSISSCSGLALPTGENINGFYWANNALNLTKMVHSGTDVLYAKDISDNFAVYAASVGYFKI